MMMRVTTAASVMDILMITSICIIGVMMNIIMFMINSMNMMMMILRLHRNSYLDDA